MSQREHFVGQGLQAIDAKGRVALPADLRSSMEVNGGGKSMYLSFNKDGECLTAFDRGWIDQRNIEIETELKDARAHGRDFDIAMARRGAFPATMPVPFDASGRFILPPPLRERAGLGDFAYFYGLMVHVEIWDPVKLLSSDRAPDEIRWHVEYEMKQRGLA